MLFKAIEKFLHNQCVTTANILFSQAVYPDSSIHSVVEGSKDERVQLTAVAKIRLNYSLCDFYGLLSEVPFLCLGSSNVLSLWEWLIASVIVLSKCGIYMLRVTHTSLYH